MTTRHTHVDLSYGFSLNGEPKPPFGIAPTNFDAHEVESLSICGEMVAGNRREGEPVTHYDWIDTKELILIDGKPVFPEA